MTVDLFWQMILAGIAGAIWAILLMTIAFCLGRALAWVLRLIGYALLGLDSAFAVVRRRD